MQANGGIKDFNILSLSMIKLASIKFISNKLISLIKKDFSTIYTRTESFLENIFQLVIFQILFFKIRSLILNQNLDNRKGDTFANTDN